ncbi:transposase [Geobacillus thermodenitrificans]|uniref:RNA-guided endonuclease InsQ/TnpB family protein n=1 Tax=Geobacillus thermodenitrificans TaxID=33940 RepID=UPI003D196F02
MYKTIIVPVKCSKEDYLYLLNCNVLSAQVWNLCLKIDKEYREQNNGDWIDRNKLQKLTKKCVHLHAKGIHHVVHKYLFARDATRRAKEEGRKDVLYPYKQKKYFVTGWDYQSVKIEGNKILLAKPMTKEKINGKFRKQKPVVCYVKNIPDNIVEIELIYRNKLYLAIKYKDKTQYKQIKSNNCAAIDLGEIHSITSIDSRGNAVIITGRKLRSIKYLRNKHQAEIYRRMSKCKRGSRQYLKYMNALRNLTYKTERRINDAVHKITKLYLDFCIENNISIVYYGDLDSATRNTKQDKKGNEFVRQKLSQWNFGEIIKQLENKLTRYGVKLIKVKEYYTSSKCPNCGRINKPKSRNYSCECGYKQHRDLVGAINILNDNVNTSIKYYKNKKYLRIA